MNCTFVFPGQGSQYVGMLQDVDQEYLVECQRVTGIKLTDSSVDYQDTIKTQLALIVKATWAIDQLKQQGVQPNMVAGHSIGAFAAAYAAEVLTFTDVLTLVYRRAYLMQQLYPHDYGMGVVVGLTRAELSPLITQLQQQGAQVYLSNANAPLQQTISGRISDIEAVFTAVKTSAVQKAKLLNVAVPSHCQLMTPMVAELTAVADQLVFKAPICPYICNIDGRNTCDIDQIKLDLTTNIIHPVLWDEMLDVAFELGMSTVLEFPPGTTLTKLIQTKFNDACKVINFDHYGIDDAVFILNKGVNKND